jgi:NAD(P)-dependent dehydrogenase (short-subunit alcohol dehydrogenase family)
MSTVFAQFDMSGKAVLVTGGGSGIGLAYAEAVAEAGAAVTIAGRSPAPIEREVARLQGLGFKIRGAQLDIADEQQVKAVFDGHQEAFGRLDAVFANAGIGDGTGFIGPTGARAPLGQIDTFDLNEWHRIINTNLTGTMYTIRHGVRLMKAKQIKGSIIVTTSTAATISVPIVPVAYMASKAGAAHLVRHVALELAASGIRVNAIAPGPFVTNIAGGALQDIEVQKIWDRTVPMGRMGQTEQIKALALYLASPASSFLTGQQITIDGGVTLGPPVP